MQYQFMAMPQQEYPVKTMCRVLEVAVSGASAWLRRAPSRRSQENTVVGERIARWYQANRQGYGSPRMHAALQAEGQHGGRKRVARLMREQGLSAKRRTHRVRTTASQHEHPVAPKLLTRDCTASAPNTRVGGRYHRGVDMGGLALSRGGAGHLLTHGGPMGHGPAPR